MKNTDQPSIHDYNTKLSLLIEQIKYGKRIFVDHGA